MVCVSLKSHLLSEKNSVKPECLHQTGLVIAEKAKTSKSETQQLDGPLQMQRSSLWCSGLMFYCTNGAECEYLWPQNPGGHRDLLWLVSGSGLCFFCWRTLYCRGIPTYLSQSEPADQSGRRRIII